MVPGRVDCLIRSFRRSRLLMVVATPAVERPVNLYTAGKPPPRRNLFKARVIRRIQLSLVVGTPANHLPIAAQGATVILTRSHLRVAQIAGRNGRYLRRSRHGCRFSRDSRCRTMLKRRLLNLRRLVDRGSFGRQGISAGDSQRRSENGRSAKCEETSAPKLSPARGDRKNQPNASFTGTAQLGSSRPGQLPHDGSAERKLGSRRAERSNHHRKSK